MIHPDVMGLWVVEVVIREPDGKHKRQRGRSKREWMTRDGGVYWVGGCRASRGPQVLHLPKVELHSADAGRDGVHQAPNGNLSRNTCF